MYLGKLSGIEHLRAQHGFLYFGPVFVRYVFVHDPHLAGIDSEIDRPVTFAEPSIFDERADFVLVPKG